MTKLSFSIGAAIALAGAAAPVQARTVSSTTGTTSNVTSIDEPIYGKDMGGMKVTTKFAGQSDIVGFWGQLSVGNRGVSFGGFGSITVGTNTNTYSDATPSSGQAGPRRVNLSTNTDLDYLTFEGGASFGGILFLTAMVPITIRSRSTFSWSPTRAFSPGAPLSRRSPSPRPTHSWGQSSWPSSDSHVDATVTLNRAS